MARHDTAPAVTLSALAPVDETVDHVRGRAGGPLIMEYGDYECPYSRAAHHEIHRVERAMDGSVRFAFRHFPLMGLHPRALAAAVAAEAAALQGRLWEMSELLFRSAKGPRGPEAARLRERAPARPREVRRGPDGPRGPRARPARRRQRTGVAAGARHADVVHRRRPASGRERRGEPARGSRGMSTNCGHVGQIRVVDRPDYIDGCEDCLAIGGRWVHLRTCQICGQVGCCDSSPNRRGVSADTLLDGAETVATYLTAWSDRGPRSTAHRGAMRENCAQEPVG